jgi:hypothetical protein
MPTTEKIAASQTGVVRRSISRRTDSAVISARIAIITQAVPSAGTVILGSSKRSSRVASRKPVSPSCDPRPTARASATVSRANMIGVLRLMTVMTLSSATGGVSGVVAVVSLTAPPSRAGGRSPGSTAAPR